MPRWLKISLRILAGLTGLVILLWIGLAWYITSHKQTILRELTGRLSERTGGTLTIRDMEPSLWKSFPNVSIALRDVSLRDSLYERHHRSLLDVKTLFVRVNTFELLSHRTEIRKITAADGSICLYTDSTGYSNTYLLSSKKKDTAQRKGGTLVDAFGLEKIDLYLIHRVKQKLFHIYIRELDGSTKLSNGAWQMHVRTDAHVHDFCFNTIRGSYLKDKDLDIDVAMTYDPDKKSLYIPNQELRISRQPIMFTGMFDFGSKPAAFNIRLHSPSIRYKTAVSWVSQNIARKLDSFDFKRPVAVDVQINGVMAYRNIPLIRVSYVIKNNILFSTAGQVDDVSFDGFYYNEAVAGNGHGDDNSQLQFRHVQGKWNSIPFTMDTLNVTNLLVPFLNVRMQSKFPLTAMNDVIAGNSFSFEQGTAEADLHYVGGVLAQDTTPYTINGFVRIGGGEINYLPRALPIRDVRATVLFKGDDLFLRDVHFASRSSTINMEGDAQHFLRFYFSDPGKILINWRVGSPQINLNDFLAFIGKRRANGAAGGKPRPSRTRIGGQIDNVLSASSIRVQANVRRLIYKHFTATDVSADASLAESGIRIDNAGLRHAGGTINITGTINQSAQNNPFRIRADIRNVDVTAIFRSFDNFGQDAIVSDNLKGKLTATAAVSGQMKENAAVISNSLNGFVDFRLEDGVLQHFSPLEKISRFVFKNRNLSYVTFKDIHNRLEIAGNRIVIPPMTIESSAVNLSLQGVYGMPKGTDIFMSIPLRNPEKEEPSTFVGKILRSGKGIVVNLRAQDGDASGVKIGWDPFKNGKKATEQSGAKP